MNKKGLDYAALLLLVVIIGLVIIFVQVQSKLDKVSNLGVNQENILRVNNDVKLFERYLRDASEIAMGNVLVEFSEIGRTKEEACPLIKKDSSPVILEPHLTTFFNQHINPYLMNHAIISKYDIPVNNFKIGIEGNDFVISAVKPITMKLAGEKGEVSVRPIIILPNYVDRFGEYDEYLERARNVLRNCDGNENPFECSKSHLKNGAVWESYDYQASGGRIQGITTKPIEIDMYKVPNTNNYKITFHTLYQSTVCYQVTLNSPAQPST